MFGFQRVHVRRWLGGLRVSRTWRSCLRPGGGSQGEACTVLRDYVRGVVRSHTRRSSLGKAICHFVNSEIKVGR